MLLLILLLPIAILSGLLAWMTWRAKHRQVAFIMGGICLVCSGISLFIIFGSLFFVQALQTPAAG